MKRSSIKDSNRGRVKIIRVAGYGRVSTPSQVIKGTSVEDQKRRIKKECKHKGFKLIKFYSDPGISGVSLENRPGIQKLIFDAEAGKIDMIMFTKLDRLARSLRDMLNFWHLIESELKLDLYCLDEPGVNTGGKFGKAMLGMLGIFAEFERDLIRERMVRGRDIKWKTGQAFPGTPPYGYRWNKEKMTIEIVPEQKEIYLRIVTLYIDQHYSMKDIANILSDDGVPTPSSSAKNWTKGRARRWNSYTISKILLDSAYKGKAVYNKYFHKRLKKDRTYMEPDINSPKPKEEWITVEFPPMITDERWQIIQERREQHKLKPKRKHKGYENNFLVHKALGKNALRCGECGARIVSHLKKRKNKKLDVYYICHNRRCSEKDLRMRGIERCNSKWINAEWLDNEVFKSISQLLSNPIYFGNKWLTVPDVSELEKEIDRIKSRLGELDLKIKKAYDLITMVEGFETEKEYKKLLENDIAEQQKLKSKLILKETELNDKSNNKKFLEELKDYYQDRDNKPLSEIWKPSFLDDEYESKFKEYLLNLPFKEKKRILEAVISPGFGGKCILRHKRYSDQCDPADIQKEMEAEINKIKKKLKPRERLMEERRILDKIYKWDKENPLIDEAPVFDLNFTIDLDKLKTIIAGLSKNGLLEKFDPFGTSVRL